MKQEILNWLKYDRTFLAGVMLLSRYSKQRGLMATLNRQGESESNNRLLQDHLGMLIGLTVNEVKQIVQVPVANYKRFKPVDEPTPPVELTREEFIRTIPEPVKKAIRLRDEFPFLSSADCPKELKILVSDMLTAYDEMKKAHEALFSAETEQELLEASIATVDSYLENREIWEELNHYKEKKEILGKHPLFELMNEFNELTALSAADLSKKQGNVRSQITRLKKAIENPKDPEKVIEYTRSLEKNEKLLTEIARLLASR